MMEFIVIDFCPPFFLLATFFLSLCLTSLLTLGKFKSKELFKSSHPPKLFFYHLLKKFFLKNEWDSLYFTLSLSKHISQLGYAITSFSYLFIRSNWLKNDLLLKEEVLSHLIWAAIFIIALSLIVDFSARLLASFWPTTSLRVSSAITSIYLIFFLPITAPLLKGIAFFLRRPPQEEEKILTDKTKIREMIRESELEQHLDPTDQKLIASFINFKERVAKEIMVPRVDVYALSSESAIEEALPLFASEGYSRIPIYKDSLDQIVGVILYKDLLKYYINPDRDPKAALETIAKPVLYSPENKKITQLLQEFRGRQIHMAIIVDEYGGTEGIVTIEDILEELVGEIEDEYDIGEEHEFWEVPGGGWVVDAKMTIHDIEGQIGLIIPSHPDYETIGGYIYHCAGNIPSKGWRLSHDAFELEILSSNERSIKKIKIIPR